MKDKILIFYIDPSNKRYIESYYKDSPYLNNLIFIKNTDLYIELEDKIIVKVRGEELDLNTVKAAYFTNTIYQQFFITKLLELYGIVCVPSFKAINTTSNKLIQGTCFILNDINIPKSIYSRDTSTIIPSLPLVKKPISGSLGNGIKVITDEKDVVEGGVFYQKIIETEDPKYDLRLIVSKNDGFICSEKRTAINGSFVTNISQKNKGEAYNPTPEEIELSLKALDSIPDMFYGGVDLMKDIDGKYYVLEINSCPGNKIIGLTGINFYGKVIDYLISL